MKTQLARIDAAGLFDVASIDALHERTLAMPGWPHDNAIAVNNSLLREALNNHRINSLLWDEEDQARRPDVPDSAIAANKRAIDKYNQRRNDAIEAMDRVILDAMARAGATTARDAWINSETAGSLIDRMSIASLKIHHMALQCRRADTDAGHREDCSRKLASLREQRDHLSRCLDTLLTGMQAGRCGYRAYRQFKMYNDPALNPYLYGATGTYGREA